MLVSYHIQLNGPLPAEVLSGKEPIHLHIFLPQSSRVTTPSQASSSGSSPPLPIPPRLGSPSPSLREEDIIAWDELFYTPEWSPEPSYFEPEVVPLSPTIAASEEALSDSETVDEAARIQYPDDLYPGGWVHLQSDIVNQIVRRIYDNPEFYPALALQFEGHDTIFGEDRRAFEGLHRVCRRLEQDAIERAAVADPAESTWEEYIEQAQQRATILQAFDNVLRINPGPAQ